MKRYDYYIVGGGPAGSVAASLLASRGYRVALLEMLSKTGLKPCGRAIPKTSDLSNMGISIPKDCIRASLDGAELYVNDKHAVSVRGLEGYIIDRTCFTSALLDKAGVELFVNSRVDFASFTAKIKGEGFVRLNSSRLIDAAGHYRYPGEMITAVQKILKINTIKNFKNNIIYIYFDTKLLGYYWVFPIESEGLLEVGVGGYSSGSDLMNKLNIFINKKIKLNNYDMYKTEGARIAVGGLYFKRKPLSIGEAAGYVLPLTGEGMRPSMLSAAAAANALAKGGDPIKAMKSLDISEAIIIHRKILNYMKKIDPLKREELLLSVPEELHRMVALGERMSKRKLLSIIRKNPKIISLLKIIL